MQQPEAKPVRPWLITRDAGFTSRFSHGILSKQITLQAAFCLCNTINMVDTLFCSYILDFLVYTAGITGSVAGSMLMFSELFNVAIGILASVLMDLYPCPKFGKHRFWILVTVVPLFLTFTILWLPNPTAWFGLEDAYTAKVVFYTVALLIFNVFYGTLIVAYEGSIPLLASDSTTLTRLNVLRLCIGSSSSVVAVLFAAATDLIMVGSTYQYFVQSAIAGGVVALLFLLWVMLAEERDAPLPKLVRKGSAVSMPVLVDFKPSARRLLRHLSIDTHHHYNIDEYQYLVDNYYARHDGNHDVDSSLELPASLPEEDFWGSTELGGDAERREIDEEYSRSAPGGLISVTEAGEEWGESDSSPEQTPKFNSPKFKFLSFNSAENLRRLEQKEESGLGGSKGGSAEEVASPSFRFRGLLSASFSPGRSAVEAGHLPSSEFRLDQVEDPATSPPDGQNWGQESLNSTAGSEQSVEAPPIENVSNVLEVEAANPMHSDQAGNNQAKPQLRDQSQHPHRGGLGVWLSHSRELLPRRPFWILIVNHFLLWAVLTFTQAALPAFLHSYLNYESSTWISGSVLVILVLQIGHAVVQLVMGFFPKQLSPEVILRFSLLLMLAAKLVFLFGFEKGLPPAWVFLVAGVDGLGEGGLFAAYEIMIPEVVWEDEARSGLRKENLIYGWVDSTRELSLALSFFGVGLILDYTKPGLAERLAVGLAPLPLLAACAYLHWLYPYIIISHHTANGDVEASKRQDFKQDHWTFSDIRQPLLQGKEREGENTKRNHFYGTGQPRSVPELSSQVPGIRELARHNEVSSENGLSRTHSLGDDLPFILDMGSPRANSEISGARETREKVRQDDESISSLFFDN